MWKAQRGGIGIKKMEKWENKAQRGSFKEKKNGFNRYGECMESDHTTIQGEKPASVPENQPKVKNPENQKINSQWAKKGPQTGRGR
jgi:hypothetical protein